MAGFLEHIGRYADTRRRQRRRYEEARAERQIRAQDVLDTESEQDRQHDTDQGDPDGIRTDVRHFTNVRFEPDHEQHEDDAVAREDVDGVRNLHDLAAAGTLDDFQ